MHADPVGGATASTGWAYWTNNRVFRDLTHPFKLRYTPYGGGAHTSAVNDSVNPFYYASYGYNQSSCFWLYLSDPWYTELLYEDLYPVSCQAFQ
jgi:hypothetical protein